MPELPEVETTVRGINSRAKGRVIVEVWSEYKSAFYKGSETIKDPKFFKIFKERVTGKKILKAKRRAKNILIHLSDDETIIVHMKMTGHFVYDRPDYPHLRMGFLLDNDKRLDLSDMRKFAKVTVEKTSSLSSSPHLQNIGLEPLDPKFTYKTFKERLLRKPRGKVKQVLMTPSVLAGVGNIYSDEILWRAGVHPASKVEKIPEKNLKLMYKALKETLAKGIALGGDSMSDYRNIEGKKGKFQEEHLVYQRTGEKCMKRGCNGEIQRLVVGGRSAHYCLKHQILYKEKHEPR